MSQKKGGQPLKKKKVEEPEDEDGGDAGGAAGGKGTGTKVKVRHILCEKVRYHII